MTTPEQDDNSHRWTHVTLRDYVDLRLREMDRNTAIRLEANEIAVKKAEDAITYRLESLNEFRKTLSDQNANYATRNELNALRAAHDAQIASLSKQIYIVVGALAMLQFILQFIA